MPTEAEIEAAARAAGNFYFNAKAFTDWNKIVEGMVIAALTAAERARWQPIETAPKDGTIFDAWLGDAAKDDIDFYCTPGTRISPAWHWYLGKFRPVRGLHSISDPPIPVFIQPTHWQPLPSPPESK